MKSFSKPIEEYSDPHSVSIDKSDDTKERKR